MEFFLINNFIDNCLDAIEAMLSELADFLVAENFIVMKKDDYQKVCFTVLDKFKSLNDHLKRDIVARKTTGLLKRKTQTLVSLFYFQLVQFAQSICIL
jgi:hypothetical protein